MNQKYYHRKNNKSFEKPYPEEKLIQDFNELSCGYSNSIKPKVYHIRSEESLNIGEVDGVSARIHFLPNFLSKEEANALFTNLWNHLNWKQREGKFKNGKKYLEPRQTCWFGKPYIYSSVKWDENESWDKDLEVILNRLNSEYVDNENRKYNSVMCNKYRHRYDSIGWHADDETSLGRNPKIASVSLGCTRVFEVCKRDEFYSNSISEIYKFHLNHGSLLIMEGSVQENWLHRVPKEFFDVDARINLTFRYIVDEIEEKEEILRRQNLKKTSNRKKSNKGHISQEEEMVVKIKESEKNETPDELKYDDISCLKDYQKFLKR